MKPTPGREKLNAQATPSKNSATELFDLFYNYSKRYYNDPVAFVEEIFGAKPTSQQKLVLNSLSSDRKVSVRAGHGVGKSTLASWAVYWFLLTRPESKIICTAPTFHQLNDILWAEAAMWRQRAPLITELFDGKQRRIECVLNPQYWWAAARTAEKGESLIGRHAGNFMLIVDEASGVENHIFEAAEGMLTGENSYVLLIGNPTKNVGYFYDSHHKDRALWKTHVLSCHDCVSEWYEGSPLTGPSYIRDMELKYGKDSNTYRIKVLGEFPHDEEDTLIPHNWIMDAVDREITISDNEPLLFGVDPGAGGDRSVIIHRRGGKIEKIKTNTSKDTMELVGWVALEAQKHKPAAIFVDPIGIGKGVFDRLLELRYRVFGVDVRRKSPDPRFAKVRDYLWWRLRDLFERGLIDIPDNDDFIRELSGVKYGPEGSQGQIKVSDKKQMRKDIGMSTDITDAVNTTLLFDDRVFAKPVDEYDIRYEEEVLPQTKDNTNHGWMRA